VRGGDSFRRTRLLALAATLAALFNIVINAWVLVSQDVPACERFSRIMMMFVSFLTIVVAALVVEQDRLLRWHLDCLDEVERLRARCRDDDDDLW